MKSTSLALLCLALGIAVGTGLGLTLSSSPSVEAADSVAPTRTATPAGRTAAAGPRDTSLPSVASTPASPETLERAAAKTSAEATALARRALVDVRGETSDVAYVGTVTGTVKGPDGAPLEGAQVICRNSAPRRDYNKIKGSSSKNVGRAWKGLSDVEESVAGSAKKAIDSRRRLRLTRTDGKGRFTLEGLREGKVTIEAYAEGFKFESESCNSGDDITLSAREIHEIRFALTMDDGTVPEEAVLHLSHSDGQSSTSSNLRWTPDEPMIRTEWSRFTVKGIAGEARRSNQNILGDAVSETQTIDVGLNGPGPHALVLERAQILVVNVDDPTLGKNDWGSDLNIVEGTVEPSFDWSDYGIAELDRSYNGPYQTAGLDPGTYTLGYTRRNSRTAVTRVIEVGTGRTELDFEIPEPTAEDHLIVLCVGPDGRPVEDVQVQTMHRAEGHSNGGQNGFKNGEPGETWIPWAAVLREGTWSAGDSLEVTATSQTLGVQTLTLTEKATRATLTYNSPSRLDVTLRGANPGEYQVTAARSKPEEESNGIPSYIGVGRSNAPGGPKRLGDDGKAAFTQLQPGTYVLTVTKAPLTSDRGWGRQTQALVTETVTVSGDTTTCSLTLPTLHEVIVSSPEAKVGTEMYLQRKGENNYFGGPTAKTDGDGRAVFEEIPAGEYTLRSRQNWQQSMSVTVPCGTVVFDPKVPNSLRVSAVVPGGVAAKAGFRNGDVIVGLDGKRAKSMQSLGMLFMKAAEESVDVLVQRGGGEVTLKLGPLGDVTGGGLGQGMNLEPHVLE